MNVGPQFIFGKQKLNKKKSIPPLIENKISTSKYTIINCLPKIILEQFLLLTMNSNNFLNEDSYTESKFCIPYFTTAVDTDNIKKVFKACSHILKKEHLEKCGLI